MSTYKQNGEYELNILELESHDGDQIDLRNIFVDFTLYESINDPSMSGSITIMDSNGLYSALSLGHGETIRCRFNTSGTDAEIEYEGYVYRASPPGKISEHAYGVVLFFMSKEYINSLKTRVKNAFDTEISNIVETVFSRVSENKRLDVEPTRHIHHIVAPSMTVFDFVSKLARRAQSVTGRYGYVFFETNKSWQFKPLESLFGQQPVAAYRYRQGGMYDDVKKREQEQFNAIQKYSIVEVDNILNQIDDGLLGSTVDNLAILEKRVITQTYKENEQFSANKSLGSYPSPVSSVYEGGYEGRKEVFISENEDPFLQSRFKNLMQVMKTQKFAAVIEIYGDSNNAVGSVVECDLPVFSANAENTGSEETDLFSGPCLVYEIKHTLKKSGYVQNMKLIKDSYEEKTS